jgi:TonB family protein
MDRFRKLLLAALLAMTACSTLPSYEQAMADFQAKDYPKAVYKFDRLANAGDTHAMMQLGSMYQYGDGVAPDIDKAAQYYMDAGKRGDARGSLAYADILFWQKADYAGAIREYDIAEDQGSGAADADLWFIYKRGMGVPPDLGLATHYYVVAMQSRDGQLQLLSLQIKDAINSNKVYPRDAILGGRTGLVTVSFEYRGGGKATEVHVDRSSGFSDIDSAAVAAVSDSLFPEIPPSLVDLHHFIIVVSFTLGNK